MHFYKNFAPYFSFVVIIIIITATVGVFLWHISEHGSAATQVIYQRENRNSKMGEEIEGNEDLQ